MNISDRIYELRRSVALSQEEFADKIGVSRQAVSKWESEQSIPDIDKVVKIANFFGVTTDYLLNGIEESRNNINYKDFLPKIATCFNYIALIIFIFDMYFSGNINPDSISNGIMIRKMLIVILIVLGTSIAFISTEKVKYKQFRKFMMINIFAYASIPSLLVYFLKVPTDWKYICYVLVVFGAYVVLLKKK